MPRCPSPLPEPTKGKPIKGEGAPQEVDFIGFPIYIFDAVGLEQLRLRLGERELAAPAKRAPTQDQKVCPDDEEELRRNLEHCSRFAPNDFALYFPGHGDPAKKRVPAASWPF
eukprot:s32_g15.t1